MALSSASKQVLDILEDLHEKVSAAGSERGAQDLASLIYMLESPLFQQLLTLQDTSKQLSQAQTQTVFKSNNLDVSTDNGKLTLHSQPDTEVEEVKAATNYNHHDELSQQKVDSLPKKYPPSYEDSESDESEVPGYDTLDKNILQAAMGREIETIALEKRPNTSLGFSVVGLRSDKKGELGVFIQEIQPSSIAANDGRLKVNDQILAINEHVLDQNLSHQQAIQILQRSVGQVELVVARGPAPQLADSEQEADAGSSEASQSVSVVPAQVSGSPPPALERNTSELSDNSDMLNAEWTQLEVIDLVNDGSGLGFGIIGGKSTGVVIKSILAGGVADKDGRLQSGDHILFIGDYNVRTFGSEQVATILRQAGTQVRLIVARPIRDSSTAARVHGPLCPVVPTTELEEQIHQFLINLADWENQILQREQLLGEEEVQYFETQLEKSTVGLGLSVVTFDSLELEVEGSPVNLPAGIYIQNVAEGGVAAAAGLQPYDQIIEVGGQSLQGFASSQAVDLLQKTGPQVHLKIARYFDSKLAFLQGYLNSPMDLENPLQELSEEEMEQLVDRWQPLLPSYCQIIVAQMSKFNPNEGLGFVIHGINQMQEEGVDVGACHFIYQILPGSPVELSGKLQPGDELLEINGQPCKGLGNEDMASLINSIPMSVTIIAARRPPQFSPVLSTENNDHMATVGATPYPESDFSMSQSLSHVPMVPSLAREAGPSQHRSADGQQVTSYSTFELRHEHLWYDQVELVQLMKSQDQALGFSVIDHKSMWTDGSSQILVKNIAPMSPAAAEGALLPGDWLVSANGRNMLGATYDEAMDILRNLPYGPVILGVRRSVTGKFKSESSTDPEDQPSAEIFTQPQGFTQNSVQQEPPVKAPTDQVLVETAQDNPGRGSPDSGSPKEAATSVSAADIKVEAMNESDEREEEEEVSKRNSLMTLQMEPLTMEDDHAAIISPHRQDRPPPDVVPRTDRGGGQMPRSVLRQVEERKANNQWAASGMSPRGAEFEQQAKLLTPRGWYGSPTSTGKVSPASKTSETSGQVEAALDNHQLNKRSGLPRPTKPAPPPPKPPRPSLDSNNTPQSALKSQGNQNIDVTAMYRHEKPKLAPKPKLGVFNSNFPKV